MTIQLYIDYLSQPSRAVLALCKLGKIPIEVHETRVIGPQIRSKQYREINPIAKVPAIVDTETGLILAESHSIMRYLALRFPQKLGAWYPIDDVVRRAKIDEYMDFHHTNTRKCAYLIFNTLFAPKLGIQDPTFSPEKARKDIDTALKWFTKIYLSKGKFVIGHSLTIADLSAYFEIQFLMLLNFDFSKWQTIRQWMDQVSKVPEVRQANSAFIKIIKKSNPKCQAVIYLILEYVLNIYQIA